MSDQHTPHNTNEAPESALATKNPDGTASAAADPDDSGDTDRPEQDEATRLRELEEEGDIAADYLEELLDIGDLDGDIDIDVDGDRPSIEIRNAAELERANGRDGELLEALQELTRLAVQTSTGNRSRLMLDIGGYRTEQRTGLKGLAETAIAEVRDTGKPVPLKPMNPFERKVVHDVVKQAGLVSDSEGEGRGRHVVIHPNR